MSDDLLIKIGADTGDAKAKLTDFAEDAAKYGKLIAAGLALEKISQLGEKVFSSLKESLVSSLEAYKEAEVTSNKLTLALQNQGIYSDELKDSYEEQAKAVSQLTGLNKDEIEQAQIVAQTFLGQTAVSEELTKAIADLAEAQGISLKQAAEEMGKAISTGTGQLKRQGLQFAATDDEAARYQKTLAFVSGRYGDFAEAGNQGLGSMRGLQNAFHEAQVELGERFAPAVTFVIKALTDFITPAEESSELMTDLKAGFLTAGIVIAGLATILPVLAQGFLAVRTAALALQIGIAPLLLIPLAIAGIIAVIVILALHWEEVSERVSQAVKGMVQFVSAAFQGLGTILNGVVTRDFSKIKDGVKAIGDAISAGWKTATATIPEDTDKALTKQEAIKKKFADKAEAFRKEQDKIKRDLAVAENEAVKLELENASADQIELKKKEIEALKALEQNRDDEQRKLLKDRIEQIRQIEDEQVKEDIARDEEFAKIRLSSQKELDREGVAYKTNLTLKETAEIKKTALTQNEIKKKAYADQLKDDIKAHNTFLEEQTKYGTAIAAIDQLIHSKQAQGIKSSTSELTGLQNSKNGTLKAIGKAAAIAQITINTAESASNVFKGFSVIPFIGTALGIAAAGAVIAYGAEQIGDVIAAQTGGIVPGSGFGDHVPGLLEPGELITPKKNFDEVVNSVADSRNGNAGTGSVNGRIGIDVGFDGPQASRVITVKQNEDKSLGISRSNS